MPPYCNTVPITMKIPVISVPLADGLLRRNRPIATTDAIRLFKTVVLMRQSRLYHDLKQRFALFILAVGTMLFCNFKICPDLSYYHTCHGACSGTERSDSNRKAANR